MKGILTKLFGLTTLCSMIAAAYPMSAAAQSAAIKLEAELVQTTEAESDNTLSDSQSYVTYSGSYYDQLDNDSKRIYNMFEEYFENGDPQAYAAAEDSYIAYSDLSFTTVIYVNWRNYQYEVNQEAKRIGECIGKAYAAFKYDHPDIAWFNGRSRYSSNSSSSFFGGTYGKITVNHTIKFSPSTVAGVTKTEMDALVAAAKAEIVESRSGFSDYDTLAAIHDYLCNTVEYNFDAADNTSDYTEAGLYAYQTAYSAFAPCNGESEVRTVCQGYASSFKVLCDRFNIPCAIITGTSRSERHAWNAVQLNGKWYAVDVTWDDQNDPDKSGKIYYDYFLAGSETLASNFGNLTFAQSHINGTEEPVFVFPTLNSTAYDPTEKSYVSYDIDGDGDFTIQDVVVLADIYLELAEGTQNQLETADFDCDGKITIEDLVVIASAYLESI